jgi:hypothetical protein
MTADEFRACLAALDWSQRLLARILGRDDRLVRRWAIGEGTIPGDVADWLKALAAFHSLHPVPLKAEAPAEAWPCR